MNFVFAGKNKIRFLVFVAFEAQKMVLDIQSKPQLNLLPLLQHQEIQTDAVLSIFELQKLKKNLVFARKNKIHILVFVAQKLLLDL